VTRDRLQKNLLIVEEISAFLEANPGYRFNQALVLLDVVREHTDDWYTEPEDVLARVQAMKALLAGRRSGG